MSKQLTYEYVVKYFKEQGCELLEDNYQNAKTKMKYRCICKNVAYITFDHFRQGQRCVNCQPERSSNAQKYSYEKVQSLFVEKGYKLIDHIYINSHTNIKCIHLKCGSIVKGTYSRLQSGQELCKKCGTEKAKQKLKFTYEFIKSELEKYKYRLLTNDYINTFQKLQCECPKHHIFEIDFNHFSRGERCPICNESKGERKICEYLEFNKYVYQRQYKFNDCRNILPLPFDFAIFDNNYLYGLIEYDGEGHFEEIYSREKFEVVQYRDNIKTNYCIQKNIPLLRIPYWDFKNIESILDSYFLMLKNNQINSKQLQNEKVG